MGHHHPTPNRMATFSIRVPGDFILGIGGGMGVGKGDEGAVATPTGKEPCHPRRGELGCPLLEPHLNRGICVSSGGWSTGRSRGPA